MGVLPPLLIAAVFLLAAWRPWQRAPERAAARWAPWLGSIGLAAALGAASLLVRGWPGWWPEEEPRRLHLVGVVAAAGVAVGTAARAGARRGGKRGWAGVLVLMGGCAAIVAWPKGWWVAVAGALAAAAVDRGIALAAERAGGSARALPAMLVGAVAAAVVCAQSFLPFGAQMAGAVATATGVAAAVAWWRRDRPVAIGFGTVYAALLVGLLLAYGGISWSARGLAVGAMLTPWLSVVPAVARRHWLVGAAVCSVTAAGFGVLAVWMTEAGLDFGGM